MKPRDSSEEVLVASRQLFHGGNEPSTRARRTFDRFERRRRYASGEMVLELEVAANNCGGRGELGGFGGRGSGRGDRRRCCRQWRQRPRSGASARAPGQHG